MSDRLRRYNLVIGPFDDDPHDLSPEDRREMLEVDWRNVRIEWVPETTSGARDGEVMHFMIDLLCMRQKRWSESTFGSDRERGPLGALRHLEKEAREAQDAVGTTEIRMEMADCFLLVLDASRRAGMSAGDLIQAAMEKQAINQRRIWPAPVGDEPVEHVRNERSD